MITELTIMTVVILVVVSGWIGQLERRIDRHDAEIRRMQRTRFDEIV